jgi:glycosyltransferase, group 2 family
MRNKLLIVCKTLTFGGVETHIKTECLIMKKKGWDVAIFVCEELDEGFFGNLESFKLFKGAVDPSFFSGLIKFQTHIEGIINGEEERYVVHCHSESLIFPLLFSCVKLNVPLVGSFHNTNYFQERHGGIYDFCNYVLTLANLSLVLVLSEEMESLIKPFVREGAYLLTRNPIIFPENASAARSGAINSRKRILVVSRLDEFKVEGIKQAILKISKILPESKFIVAGEGDKKEELKKNLLGLMNESRIEFVGLLTKDKYDFMSKADYVIGMGRVALEAIGVGTPVLLTGYSDIKGLLQDKNFNKMAATNFSGRNIPTISEKDLRSELELVINEENLRKLKRLAREKFDAEIIWSDVSKIFQTLKPNFGQEKLLRAIGDLTSKIPENERVLESLSYLDRVAKLVFSRNLFDIKIALPFEYFFNNYKDEKIKTLEQIDFYHKRDNKKLKQTINDLEEENNSVHQKLNELQRQIDCSEKQIEELTKQLSLSTEKNIELTNKIKSLDVGKENKEIYLNKLGNPIFFKRHILNIIRRFKRGTHE